MFAFAVGQCCCACTDCCNGAYANEWDVDASFGSSTCASSPFCNFATGTFTLQKITGAGCKWLYEYLNPENILDGPDCAAYSPWYLDSLSYELSINCINDTQYGVTLTVRLSAQRRLDCIGGTTSYMSTLDTITYTAIVNVAEFDCEAAADFEVTKTSHVTDYFGASCAVQEFGFISRPTWILGPLCSSPSTITITAVS